VQVWSWGIVVWEIFNMANIPYSNFQTNHEVMNAVAGGHRLELGNRLKGDDRLAKLAALVEDSWDGNADSRPTFKHLARKCEHLFESLKAVDAVDEDSDTAIVLKEIQKDAYSGPNRLTSSFYGKGDQFYEDEVGEQLSTPDPDPNFLYEHDRQ
jgi:Protein tyrosine and serine/threonine kinase